MLLSGIFNAGRLLGNIIFLQCGIDTFILVNNTEYLQHWLILWDLSFSTHT